MCKKNIFVAYNTDSIVKIIKKKYHKEKSKNNCEISNDCSWPVSNEIKKERIECFKNLTENIANDKTINIKGNEYILYFDILDNEKQDTELNEHVPDNRKKIKECALVIYVISKEEISFWQLQEAFFASYFNKNVIMLTTEDFFKLVYKKRFNKFLKKQMKKLKLY